MSRRKGKREKNRWEDQGRKPSDAKRDDESMADRAIAAELDHAMGVDNPDYDWLVEPYK